MRRLTCGGLLTLVAVLLSVPCAAPAAEYHVDTDADNVVRFVSDAPIEDFDGVTSQIDGYVFWPGEEMPDSNRLESSQLYFEVALATLKTGIGLRDSHMRERYLETAKYPYATFEGTLSAIKPVGNGAYEVVATGRFGVHGVTRPMTTTCRVQTTATGFRVRANFEVKLPDHNIEVPSLMFMKISEEIQVELEFSLRIAPESP